MLIIDIDYFPPTKFFLVIESQIAMESGALLCD